MPTAKSKPRRNQSPANSHLRGFIVPLGLLIALLLAYFPAIRAGYIWDDDQYVHQNSLLTQPGSLARIWTSPTASPQYYPLVFTTFWIEHQLWGNAPMGYHVVNVLLHGTAALLLWRVLLRLSIPGALIAAGLFAFHPLQVESVAWVTERKNVLSAVFYFAAALAYLKHLGLQLPAGARAGDESARPINRSYIISLACFVCALLSKTVACSLPAALAVVIWWKCGKVSRRNWAALAPMFGMGLAAALVTAWIERSHVGAVGPEFALSFAQRAIIAGRALWFYAGKFVWPSPLIFIYPRWQIDPARLIEWTWPIAAAAIPLILWAGRRRIGHGPLAGCLFFYGTLLPALGFVNVYPMRYSFVADHFQYIACVGLIVPVAAWATHAVPPSMRENLYSAFGAVLVLFVVLTYRQCHQYRDEETLWAATLERNPAAWIALNNLGYIHVENGQVDRGITEMKRAVEINPNYAEGHSNLGGFLFQQGRWEESLAELSAAIRLDPSLSTARGNLGAVLLHFGRTDEALREFEAALRVNPESYFVRFNLGCALAHLGRATEAVEHLQWALQANPQDAEARACLQKAMEGLSKKPS